MRDNIIVDRRQRLGRPLIAAHRGTAAGCVFPNTRAACAVALASGTDIVELDTVRTTDGIYVTFHDGYEAQLLGEHRKLGELSSAEVSELKYGRTLGAAGVAPVEGYGDVVGALPGVLVNVDRSYRYWKDGFLERLATWADPEYMLVKSPVVPDYLDALAGCGVDYPFIPIVSSTDDVEAVLGYEGLHIVGLEILARSEGDALADPGYVAGLRERGLAIWVNAINLESGIPLYCGWDDMTSVLDEPDRGWGRLVSLNADVIQTDFPWLLRAYLEGAWPAR